MQKPLLGLFIILVFFSKSVCAEFKIYAPNSKQDISLDQFLLQTQNTDNFVFGEFHGDGPIQQAQADLMKNIVEFRGTEQNFDLGWEFLNFEDQDRNSKILKEYADGNLERDLLMKDLFPGNSNLEYYNTYLPLFDVLKTHQGSLLSLNVSREIKTQVREKGLESLDQKYIPPFFKLGGDNYFDRFKEAMGEHIPADKLPSYFLAQCYTDDMMAWQMEIQKTKKLQFLVMGAFHTDFYDGFLARLDSYQTNLRLISVKFVNAQKMNDEDLKEFIGGSSEYGPYADYIVITESPTHQK